MKLSLAAVAAVTVLVGLSGLTTACGEQPSTLSNESGENGTIAGGPDRKKTTDDGADDEKTSKDATDPAPAQATTPAKTTTPAATTTAAKACDPAAAKTATECTKCCAEQAAPAPKAGANDCACAAASKCATACKDSSVCSAGGASPGIECSLCMFAEKCDFGLDLGGLGQGTADDSAACFKQCESKP